MNTEKLVYLLTIIVISAITPFPTLASTITIGPNGIGSAGLSDFNGAPLNGAGIDIGQLEATRPGDPNFDTDVSLFHSSVEPEEVFYRNEPLLGFTPTMNDPMNNEIDAHTVQVAGIMISSDTSDPDEDGDSPTGVAPGASLFSVGYNAAPPFFDSEIAISAQHLATLPGQSVRAINMSFAIPLASGQTLDGNQLLTQYIDWSAAKHDILYVVAGNQDTDTDSVPTDNFNGMTIASSGRVGGTGKYLQVSGFNRYNQDAEGDRTSIDLIAPGEEVKTTTTSVLGDMTLVGSGTSYAVPHVTATVALAQQYGDERILNSGNALQWNLNARQPEVMKAVLMNSADKIKDTSNNGKYLGMERTVLKQDGVSDWLDSDAYLENGFLDTDTPARRANGRRPSQRQTDGSTIPPRRAGNQRQFWDYDHGLCAAHWLGLRNDQWPQFPDQ